MPDPRELAPVAPELFVPDVAAAVRFYTEALGFEPVRVEPDFAVVSLGAAVVMLAHEGMYGPARVGGIGPRGVALDIRIMVPDVDATHRRVIQAGIPVVYPIANREYGLRDFIITDPNGFRLRFASPLKGARHADRGQTIAAPAENRMPPHSAEPGKRGVQRGGAPSRAGGCPPDQQTTCAGGRVGQTTPATGATPSAGPPKHTPLAHKKRGRVPQDPPPLSLRGLCA